MPRPNRDRLTAEGVADLLGVRPSTVRSYAARGQMPKPTPCPCCGHTSWDRQAVAAWRQERKTR